MLALKPHCESCNKALPPTSDSAFICSFECTFCADCTTGHLKRTCPNCQGELTPRPRRPEALLAKYPPAKSSDPS